MLEKTAVASTRSPLGRSEEGFRGMPEEEIPRKAYYACCSDARWVMKFFLKFPLARLQGL